MHLYCPLVADNGLVNINFFFRAYLQVNVPFQEYIVFQRDWKGLQLYEQFLVQSKKIIFDVNVALANLEFHVHVTSEYICRQCHGVLKKKSNLQQNLENLQKSRE